MITFTAGDLREPAHDLPRAMYAALGVTSLSYVLIALGVFGTLTVTEVIGYGETAIAEAARPDARRRRVHRHGDRRPAVDRGRDERHAVRLGEPDRDARRGRAVPVVLRRGSRLGKHAGLLITAGLVLVVANLVDLSAIASVGSAVALDDLPARRRCWLPAASRHRQQPRRSSSLAIAVTAIVLGFFAVDTLQNAPETFVAIIGIGLLSVVLDAIVRHGRGKQGAPTTGG